MGEHETETAGKLMETPKEGAPNSDAKAPESSDKQLEGEKPEGNSTESTADNLQAKIDEAIQSVKAGYEGTITKMRDEIGGLKKTVKEAEATREEQALTELLRRFEDGGIPKDATASFAEASRQLAQRIREHTEASTSLKEEKVKVTAGLKEIRLDQLIKEFKLDKTAREELSKVETAEKMRERALELALANSSSAATPPKKVDDGGNKGGSEDLSKMHPTQIAGKLWGEALEK